MALKYLYGLEKNKTLNNTEPILCFKKNLDQEVGMNDILPKGISATNNGKNTI